MGFSQELNYYAQNLDSIQDKINPIEDEKLRKRFSRTKEDFEIASEFFSKLHGKEKKI